MKIQHLLYLLLLINLNLKAIEIGISNNMRAKGFIAGTILDAETLQPIEYAGVSIQNSSDSALVTGGITDALGNFNIPDVPFGNYIVKYKFIGYDEGCVNGVILNTTQGVNLGNLKIKVSRKQLDEVVVTGQKSLYETKIDRKVFNADQIIVGKSGNASELLKQVPSVDVDIDGKVSLRGSENVTILLNGKPMPSGNVTSYLQQMQANSIEKIEVITNPSAKYDPDGTAGILNIVLKKGATQGFNGSANANTGTWNKYNAGLNLNYNPGKYNIFGSYNVRRDNKWNTSRTNRTSFINSDTVNAFTTGRENSHNVNHNVKLGFDLFLNDKNTFGLTGGATTKTIVDSDKVNYSNTYKTYIDNYNRKTLENETGFEYDVMTYFQHNFNEKDHNIRFDANYSNNHENNTSNYKQSNIPAVLWSEINNTKHNFKIYAVQTDYNLPLLNESNIQLGAKIQSKTDATNLIADTLNLISNIWENNIIKTNNFEYTENITAFYGTFLKKMGRFGFMIGLRAEYSNIIPYLKTLNIRNNNENYQLYPTLHISEKITENNELSVSYSRRVNRPGGHQLNPFPDYADPKNIRVGNPYLKPEFINSIELGYTWKKNRNTIQPTIFYRYTQNAFTRFQEQISPTAMRVSFQNLNSNKSFGADINANWQILKFWNINTGASGYQYFINGSNFNSNPTNKQGFGYNAKLMSNTMLPMGIGIQIGIHYRSPFVTTQGKSAPMFGTNLGIKKEVFKGKGTLTLSVNDLFDTQHFQMTSSGSNFYGNMKRKRESQVLFVGFIYRFGSTQRNGKKDKTRENENMGGAEDNMY